VREVLSKDKILDICFNTMSSSSTTQLRVDMCRESYLEIGAPDTDFEKPQNQQLQLPSEHMSGILSKDNITDVYSNATPRL